MEILSPSFIHPFFPPFPFPSHILVDPIHAPRCTTSGPVVPRSRPTLARALACHAAPAKMSKLPLLWTFLITYLSPSQDAVIGTPALGPFCHPAWWRFPLAVLEIEEPTDRNALLSKRLSQTTAVHTSSEVWDTRNSVLPIRMQFSVHITVSLGCSLFIKHVQWYRKTPTPPPQRPSPFFSLPLRLTPFLVWPANGIFQRNDRMIHQITNRLQGSQVLKMSDYLIITVQFSFHDLNIPLREKWSLDPVDTTYTEHYNTHINF